MNSKEFDALVNADIRGQATEEDSAWLRHDDNVLQWKFSLRTILGALKSSRAAKLSSVHAGGGEMAKAEYYAWAAKSEWFQSAVENRFEEASIAVDDLYDYEDEVTDDL